MSVEITGPKGYEWQYRITCLIAIQNMDCDKLEIEADGGEDARLQLHDTPNIQIFEIQAKSSAASVDMAILCEWLCHFPSHDSTSPLITKLDEDNITVLFVTGGRCTDSTSPFINRLGILDHHTKIGKATWETLVIELIKYAESYPDHSKLKKRRKDSLITIAHELKSRGAKIIENLRKILIWESVYNENMEVGLTSILTKEHRIPQLKCLPVVYELEAAIRDARDNRGDASYEICEILKAKSPIGFLSGASHILLGQEIDLLESLKENHFLLLEGRSQSGKTNIAKFLAQRMQESGVECQHGDKAIDAKRFLTERNEAPRLYLLEDPFNQQDLVKSQTDADILRKLKTDINNHRYLIVTSTSEDCNAIKHLLSANEWIDTTIRDKEKLIEVWNKQFENEPNLLKVGEKLTLGFNNLTPEELPQIGHLLHLSKSPKIETLSFDRLITIARFDITTLAQEILAMSGTLNKLCVALRAGCSTIHQITVDELGFILSNTDERPSFDDDLGISISGSRPTIKFPKATRKFPLSTEYTEGLRYLEEKGYIRVNQAGIAFSHPDYFSTASKVTASASYLLQADCIKLVSRGISSVDEAVAVSCASTLLLLYNSYGTTDKNKLEIFKVAKHARNSIFPAVRESTLEAVIQWIPSLPKKKQSEALDLIVSTEHTYAYSVIKWENNSPWTASSRSWDELCLGEDFSLNTKLESQLKQLCEGNAKQGINAQDAWRLVHYIEASKPDTIHVEALLDLMNQSYGFIRAKAISLLIKRDIDRPERYLSSLEGEANPSVLRSAITQIFASWSDAEPNSKSLLQTWLIEAFSNMPIAIVCSGLIVNFGDVYKSGIPDYRKLSNEKRVELFDLWAELARTYLNTVSDIPSAHSAAHMYNTLSVAVRHSNKSAMSRVAEAWATWIFGQLEIRMLDDSALPVAELLLTQTDQGQSRETLLAQLLQHKDTGLAVTTVHFLIQHWSLTSEAEKVLLLHELVRDRVDARWLRAVAITRDEVPAEVQELLLSDKNLLENPPEELLKKCPNELLSDALHLYCGKPQPLWWYGLHHDAKARWQKVLSAILCEPTHAKLQLAVFEMLYSYAAEWENASKLWRSLCITGGDTVRQQLFEQLLQYSVEVTGPQSYDFWEILFETSKSEIETSDYAMRIIDNLEVISMNVDSVQVFLGKAVWIKHIQPHLQAELRLLHLCKVIKQNDSQKISEVAIKSLEDVIVSSPPKIIQIYSVISSVLERSDHLSAKLALKTVQKERSNFLDRKNKQRDKIKTKEEIWDWVFAFEDTSDTR